MLYLYKIINRIYLDISTFFSYFYLKVVLNALPIKIGKNYKINGFPRIILKGNSILEIGNGFSMNSGFLHNPIGRNQRCILSVSENASLLIGHNVGVSSSAIICQELIKIGDNVRIGGNTIIYDTDFHSLNVLERTSIPEVKKNVSTKKIEIKNNVFIGGHCIVLKGVIIGENSIVGAGSVVSKNIPANEIWAGNPIQFVKKIGNNESNKVN